VLVVEAVEKEGGQDKKRGVDFQACCPIVQEGAAQRDRYDLETDRHKGVAVPLDIVEKGSTAKSERVSDRQAQGCRMGLAVEKWVVAPTGVAAPDRFVKVVDATRNMDLGDQRSGRGCTSRLDSSCRT
jgi:hypothetical protein